MARKPTGTYSSAAYARKTTNMKQSMQLEDFIFILAIGTADWHKVQDLAVQLGVTIKLQITLPKASDE